MSIDGAGDIQRTIPGVDERAALGKLLRQQVPRRLHGQWTPAPDRPDPLDVVRARNRGRQRRLVPIRLGRMVASPFTFYRGSADLMAIDLWPTPATGMVVQLCGDAHLSNFGVYASPERHLALDINDFDETSRGRWEWDVKRLVASVELCGRDNGLSTETRAEAVATGSRAYRMQMARMSSIPRLDAHYLTFGEGTTLPKHWCPESLALIARMRDRAHARTNGQLGERLTDEAGTSFRFNPPLLTKPAQPVRDAVVASLGPYLETVSPDIHELLKDYGVVDVAHKVVGVGSVGTRDYIVLLQGNYVGDRLLLQVKEALPSVVQDRGLVRHRHHGQQVVDGQRRIQSVSDPFLGWTSCRLPSLLRAPAARHEGLRRSEAAPGRRAPRLRGDLRGHPGQGARPHRVPVRHRQLLREQRQLRPPDGGLRPRLRGPGRAGPRRAGPSGQGRNPPRRAGRLTGRQPARWKRRR